MEGAFTALNGFKMNPMMSEEMQKTFSPHKNFRIQSKTKNLEDN